MTDQQLDKMLDEVRTQQRQMDSIITAKTIEENAMLKRRLILYADAKRRKHAK